MGKDGGRSRDRIVFKIFKSTLNSHFFLIIGKDGRRVHSP